MSSATAGKAEKVVYDWDDANVPGRHRILARLGLHYKVTRLDNRKFEELPQSLQRSIAHTVEALKD